MCYILHSLIFSTLCLTSYQLMNVYEDLLGISAGIACMFVNIRGGMELESHHRIQLIWCWIGVGERLVNGGY